MNQNDQNYDLAMPDAALYGELGDAMRTTDAPLGVAYAMALALVAGQGINLHDPEPNPRPTLYVIAPGKSESGKSATFTRVRKTLNYDRSHYKPSALVSDRGVFSLFRDGFDKKDPAPTLPIPCTTYSDELRSMLKKMRIENSALAELLNTMFYEDFHSVSDKGGLTEINARLSIIGCLTADDPDDFQEWMGVETQNGFSKRVIITPVPADWYWADEWEPSPINAPRPKSNKWAFDDVEIEVEPDPLADLPQSKLPFKPLNRVTFPKELYAVVRKWEAPYKSGGINPGRVKEIALRIAVISSAANQEPVVSLECLKAALAFADWQMAVRKVYRPSDAQNEEARITGVILRGFETVHKAEAEGNPVWVGDRKVAEGRWVKLAQLDRKFNISRKYGASALRRIIDSLVATGHMEQQRINPDKPASRDNLLPNYRLLDLDLLAPKSSIPMPTAAAEMNDAA